MIPLNPPWLNYETGASLTNLFVNFFGILNAAGHASPYVNVPQIPALAGTRRQRDLRDARIPGARRSSTSSRLRRRRILAGPAPVITTVTPPNGPTTGGTAITITGNELPGRGDGPDRRRSRDGRVVSPCRAASTASRPPGTLGAKPVVGDESGHRRRCTLPNGFTYVTPLVLTTVTPLVAAPGVAIVDHGQRVPDRGLAARRGRAVTPLSVTPTQITFTNPASVPCGGPMQVTNPDAQTASMPSTRARRSHASRLPDRRPEETAISVVGSQLLRGLDRAGQRQRRSRRRSSGPRSSPLTMPAGSPGPVPITVTSMNGCVSAAATYSYQ